MEITLVKQTDRYLVCVKPQGVESEQEMPRLLQAQTGEQTVLPVHRLDKETGGVMVYAKTKSAAAELSAQVQRGEMEKTYLAVVQGVLQSAEGRWEDLLFRDRTRNKSYIVKRERKGVKRASLSYKVLAQTTVEGQTVSLVTVALHTGRTHQIRVQFSGRNHPLVGDRRYGGMPCRQLGLWSAKLCFFDRGKAQTFTRIPPSEEIPWQWFPNCSFVQGNNDLSLVTAENL